jgi:hypothetical protein
VTSEVEGVAKSLGCRRALDDRREVEHGKRRDGHRLRVPTSCVPGALDPYADDHLAQRDRDGRPRRTGKRDESQKLKRRRPDAEQHHDGITR